MRLFKSESVYDSTTKQWIEKFWINGEEVDGETYFSMIDQEKSIEDSKLEDKDCDNCDDCNWCENCPEKVEEDEGISYDEILDIFTERIQEVGSCPICIKSILEEFAGIFIPDECEEVEDNEGEEEFNEGDIYNITFNINCEKELDAEQIFKQISDGLKKVGV